MGAAKKKVLIAGVSGLVGGAALERFAHREEWDVVGVSRRKPWIPLGSAKHLSVDLLDRAACAALFGEMSDVHYVVFAALNERDDDIQAGWRDPELIVWLHNSNLSQVLKTRWGCQRHRQWVE